MPRGGFKRSRALWDATREPQPSLVDTIRVWLQAIAYELQPVRMDTVNQRQWMSSWIRSVGRGIWNGILSTPALIRLLWAFLKSRTRKHWMVVAAILAYYFAVRWIHDMLDAGPIVIIVTCLVAIFTIGLGDEENRSGLSAYSVFNRGFERLLGSVDADALLAQHVGGGLGGVGFNNNQNHFQEEEEANVARRNPPAAARPNPDNNNENDDNQNDDNNNNNTNNRSRKSGKKARRRNLEERRELRQQREAAVALGMHGDETQEEMMAMQRLIEEQLAAQNNQQ